uniref:Uncharacterized protein n=1 Tax=Lepeophtheirus salmonis TaxID=72036 RepID=A0A0K2SZA1_LEPSM
MLNGIIIPQLTLDNICSEQSMRHEATRQFPRLDVVLNLKTHLISRQIFAQLRRLWRVKLDLKETVTGLASQLLTDSTIPRNPVRNFVSFIHINQTKVILFNQVQVFRHFVHQLIPARLFIQLHLDDGPIQQRHFHFHHSKPSIHPQSNTDNSPQ